MVGRPSSDRRLAALGLFVVGVVVVGVVAVGLALLPSDAARAAERETVSEWICQAKICQRVTQRGVSLTFELRNDLDQPTYVALEVHGLANVKRLQTTPFVVRLEPGEVRTAGGLAIQDGKQSHAYRTEWRALPGNPNVVHDDRWQYRMPFGGTSAIRISQGYDGPFTHKGLGAYALDFPMNSGTPVLAARGGTIAEVVDDKVTSGVRTGENEGDNRVVIEHADGTFAIYAHLRPGGSARVGQPVESGDRIGLSGDTGFSTGPHLHFEVYKVRRDGRRQTLPVKFWNGTEAGFTALAGLEVEPGCPRGGGSSCLPGELASEEARDAPGRSVPAAPDPTASE